MSIFAGVYGIYDEGLKVNQSALGQVLHQKSVKYTCKFYWPDQTDACVGHFCHGHAFVSTCFVKMTMENVCFTSVLL